MLGLDSNNILEFQNMVLSGKYSGKYLRAWMDTKVESEVYKSKNLDLIKWLRDKKYHDTADHLAEYVRGERQPGDN